MVAKLLKEIESFFAKNAIEDDIDFFEDYKEIKGASDDELQGFEEHFSIALPDEFKELYKLKNGSSFLFNLLYPTCGKEYVTGFSLMSLEEIKQKKTYFCKEDKLLSDYPDYFTEEDIKRVDERVKAYYANKRWIPFAQADSFYLMLDFDPTEKGEKGQIILFLHDPDTISFMCTSISQLLQNTVDNLKDGWYEEIMG